MSQNIYDDRDFFAGYSQLRRSREGLDGAPEWPALRALLPDLAGRTVVDLGCGFGWFSRWARANGAASVVGIDISAKMLERARAEPYDGAISYLRADLEALALPAVSFDLAYSSLALHYVADLERLVRVVYHALNPGGRFVFSIEHPIYMAPAEPGWLTGEDGRKRWPIDGYLVEGPRVTNWLADGVVKHHRTLGTTLNLLIRTGFRIAHVEEFCPTAEQIALNPALEEERERPMFVLIAANR